MTEGDRLAQLKPGVPNPVEISALTGDGLEDLLAMLETESRLEEPVPVEPPSVADLPL